MSNLIDLIPTVIAEAQGARAELAAELANAFVQTPNSFDPKHLERLGRGGLAMFLASIGQAGIAVSAKTTSLDASMPPPCPAQGQPPTGKADRHDQGWSNLQRPERSYWMSGVLAGLRTGALVVAAGVTAFALVDHGLPFLRGVLS